MSGFTIIRTECTWIMGFMLVSTHKAVEMGMGMGAVHDVLFWNLASIVVYTISTLCTLMFFEWNIPNTAL